MLIVFDVLPLGSRANIECRRVNARFCESSGLHTYASFSPRSRHTTDVLFFPFYGHRSLHLPCRYRRDMGRDPAVISKSFCVGALRGTYHYSDVFVRPVSRQPSVLVRRASLAKKLCSHTFPYDHLRIRLPNQQTIELIKQRVGIALISNSGFR